MTSYEPGPLLRARRAMEAGRIEDALHAADDAIEAALQGGLTLAEFMRLSREGADADALLRFGRAATGRLRELAAPFAIRWEALHRLGRRREAAAMRELCTRHWPERASVWATAGNHALDHDDVERAEAYFTRCLLLDPRSLTGLAGRAIVCERRKDWLGALAHREAVATVSGALEGDDPASLHRMLRLAAVNGRLGRWARAGRLARRAVRAGAFRTLPEERSMLLRVFSRGWRAPAMLAWMLGDAGGYTGALDDDVLRGLTDALCLAAARREVNPADRGTLGAIAWLAGDVEAAFAHCDAADEEVPDDPRVSFFLLAAAEELEVAELESIRGFAGLAATKVLHAPDAQRPRDVFYAHLVRCRIGSRAPELRSPLDVGDAPHEIWCADAALAWTQAGERRGWQIAGAEGTPRAPVSDAERALAEAVGEGEPALFPRIHDALARGAIGLRAAFSLALFVSRVRVADARPADARALAVALVRAFAPTDGPSDAWEHVTTLAAWSALVSETWSHALTRAPRDYPRFRAALRDTEERRGDAATRLGAVLERLG
jgi:tetratricopeptide (TPR) repeat protein